MRDDGGSRSLMNRSVAVPPSNLPVAELLAILTVSEMSVKGSLWDAIVACYGLHPMLFRRISRSTVARSKK
jgi:hypothetical protein